MTKLQNEILNNLKIAMAEMSEQEQHELYIAAKAFAVLSTLRTNERLETNKAG